MLRIENLMEMFTNGVDAPIDFTQQCAEDTLEGVGEKLALAGSPVNAYCLRSASADFN
jgi:hypothetical protein